MGADRQAGRGCPGRSDPGLLASEFYGASADPSADLGRLIAADRSGRIAEPGDARLHVTAAGLDELGEITAAGGREIVIALAMPKVRGQRLVSIGISGAGFDGVLESRSTRLEGLVSAIDIAPTLLERFGRELPSGVDGREITSDPDGDAAEVTELRERLLELSPRRTPVVWLNAAIWVLLAAAASLGLGARGRRLALPWLAAAFAALPAMLLVGAALQPAEGVERLIVGLGTPALAWLLVRLAGGYGGFALGAALSVGAYAIDVIAGSPLTALTVGGSNPSSGVRFFGIGNEHEAALSALTIAGAGAALTAWWPGIDRRRGAALIAAAATLAVLAFAPGRFGADVGMAITLPAGAAVAVAILLGASRRGWLLVLLAPVAGLAALIAIDLISGGDAHLSRSVLDAEDSGAVGEVLEGRLRLAWGSIERNADSPFLWAALALIGLALWRRRAVSAALAGAPRAALAGLAGALAAIVAGTLANDSGITLFVIGIWFVIPFAGLIYETNSADIPDSR